MHDFKIEVEQIVEYVCKSNIQSGRQVFAVEVEETTVVGHDFELLASQIIREVFDPLTYRYEFLVSD